MRGGCWELVASQVGKFEVAAQLIEAGGEDSAGGCGGVERSGGGAAGMGSWRMRGLLMRRRWRFGRLSRRRRRTWATLLSKIGRTD